MHHVYVMPGEVGKRVSRRPDRNAFVQWCIDNRGLLEGAVEDELDSYLFHEHEEDQRIRKWAAHALMELNAGEEITKVRFGRTHAGSRQKGREDTSSMATALTAVFYAGRRGTTSLEAETAYSHGGISGALSKLHRAGVVACLEEKR